jgi:dynein heavy chain 1
MDSIQIYLKQVFGEKSFVLEGNKLVQITQNSIQRSTLCPFILCSDKGYDISHRVESLSKSGSQSLVSVAMGTNESIKLADSAIQQGIRTGCWVLIKNAHLAIEWLSDLEKRLPTLPSSQIKLFICTEVHARFPTNLLRASRIIMFEPPNGLRSSILESIGSITREVLISGPVEKNRVVFMIAWLHGVILERLRYIPLGWSKNYDFNDSDFDMALSLTETWFKTTANGKSNLNPENIPWSALQSLISENVYGGKIDCDVDTVILKTIVRQYLNPQIFDSDYRLVDDLLAPNGIHIADFKTWTKSMNESEPPNWLGLPSESDNLMKKSKANVLLAKLKKFNNLTETTDRKLISKIIETEKVNTLLSLLEIVFFIN